MGCCFSRPSGPNSPYPGGVGASGSARAINDAQHTQQTTLAGPNPATSAAHARHAHPQQQQQAVAIGGGGVAADAAARAHHHRHRNQPLSQHINKPLRRHEWNSLAANPPGHYGGRNLSRGKVWTARALARERDEFFDTRVTGRQEIWQAMRAALEVLWEADAAARRDRLVRARERRLRNESGTDTGAAPGGEDGADNRPPPAEGQEQEQGPGDAEDDDDDDDGEQVEGAGGPSEEDRAIALATAQGILAAAEITLPTGDLANGAYDALGNYYALPEHVVSDPTNLAGSDVDDDGLADAKGELAAGAGGGGDDDTVDEDDGQGTIPTDDDDEDAAERRREEKGKAVVDVRDQVTVRARLSDGSRDVTISLGKSETVRSLARRIADEAGLASTKKVRIAYMGKILKENSALTAQGWKQGHVVNALVFNR